MVRAIVLYSKEPVLTSQDNDILNRFYRASDELERHEITRNYLDFHKNGTASSRLLVVFFSDKSDLIRSEAADYLINNGGLTAGELIRMIRIEKSDLVLPRIWLALALQDKNAYIEELNNINNEKSIIEQVYLDAANYVAYKESIFIYKLCEFACSKDLPASHTAIDLLNFIVPERLSLFQNLVEDLERDNADNVNKAKRILLNIDC